MYHPNIQRSLMILIFLLQMSNPGERERESYSSCRQTDHEQQPDREAETCPGRAQNAPQKSYLLLATLNFK